MKAQELRIGNLISQNGFFGYVYSIESALPRQEERFSDKDLVTLFDNGITTVPIEEVKPIPLTEEWLIKFGFYSEKQIWRYKISNYDWIDIVEFYDEGWFVLDNENGHFNSVGIKHVHQLQNLHFALTGGELELSSNVA